jgi:hypothetical protein
VLARSYLLLNVLQNEEVMMVSASAGMGEGQETMLLWKSKVSVWWLLGLATMIVAMILMPKSLMASTWSVLYRIIADLLRLMRDLLRDARH